ncbi:MAG: glycine--tRNA ligase subunit beta [Chloroflexi bacterium]|nr:glycine--tRNA ligase subunit beta [Chloroflexota bacterium]
MASTNDFQTIILNLQNFWHEQGCLIWQPYHTQVGAGTNNPATVLRVLGPEPWNVAYVEPSIRPDDARYGENPYRLQQHYQFQVIMKPDPGNPQELYLRSLMALGIDPHQHDIRFVEDNWESPALGAWGLGWEVWLDGQEITQFTYFQQAGGMPMNPVSVEITYGLERIAMPLQRVRHFTRIQWSPERTYGDVNQVSEQEYSKYFFEVADVNRLRNLFDLYEKEALLALDNGLVLPAHDYVLQCSHTFNILDTRGAVGVTERQDLFRRMRDISRRVAETYYEQRQKLEFPWLREENPASHLKDAWKKPEPAVAALNTAVLPDQADFLFEIGTEELPAGDQESALSQMKELTTKMLEETRLSFSSFQVLGTPRRLAIYVKDLTSRQEDSTRIHKGPPAGRAFDADGKPTQAAIGFARGKGVAVEALEVVEMDGGKYVAATVLEKGRSTPDVLSEALPRLIASIHFERGMRWNSADLSFSRPIRWLLALFDGEIIPFQYAGLDSGRRTRGLRFHIPEEFEVGSIADYFAKLAAQGIILDPVQRREVIRKQVCDVIEAVHGSPDIDEHLLDEVNYLVEAPTALAGRFEEEHLKLPEAVLISVMKKYQRYFPVHSMRSGNLLPYFILVRNGGREFAETIVDGNELVIKARFADAAFFIHEDRKQPLEGFLPKLDTLVFQKDLGSMLDKTHRVTELAKQLGSQAGITGDELEHLLRAARLAKADLVTHMVVEMTSLQGIMGRYYAQQSGEDPLTAEAIYEHYLPAFAGDVLPTTRVGFVLGLADRLDSLIGLFAAGMAPTGTKDPFAQRRMALGVIQLLTGWKQEIDLRQVLKIAAEKLPIPCSPEVLNDCLAFITGRMRNEFLERGYPYDVVDAVLAVQSHNPYSTLEAVKQLSEWTHRADWREILPAFSRCVRITRDKQEVFSVQPEELSLPAEKDLYAALLQAETLARQPGSVDDFLNAFLPVIPAINRFFNEVMVMSDQEMERRNRLGLLQRLVKLSATAADLSYLEGF